MPCYYTQNTQSNNYYQATDYVYVTDSMATTVVWRNTAYHRHVSSGWWFKSSLLCFRSCRLLSANTCTVTA